MSTQTREQAWENYDREVCRPRVYDVYQRLIADTAFKAAWSARDAEIARLTADNAELREAVAVLRKATRPAVVALDSFIPDDDLHSPNNAALFGLTQALAATSRFAEEPTDAK